MINEVKSLKIDKKYFHRKGQQDTWYIFKFEKSIYVIEKKKFNYINPERHSNKLCDNANNKWPN